MPYFSSYLNTMYWNRQLHSFSPPNTSERPSTVEPTTEKPTTEEPTPTDQCGVSGTPFSKISIYIKSKCMTTCYAYYHMYENYFNFQDKGLESLMGGNVG